MSPQFSIAHYRITAKLGQGGMGEVWRATDTKLNRDVAIKVLTDDLAQDVDRMTRFAHEAQVLASLNHPNIAIYGVEDRAFVLELVEGATLADRIARGHRQVDPGFVRPEEVLTFRLSIPGALVTHGLRLADGQPAIDAGHINTLLNGLPEALKKNHHRHKAREIETRATALLRASSPHTVIDVSDLVTPPKPGRK
jgi:serine/threonine protein kinase